MLDDKHDVKRPHQLGLELTPLVGGNDVWDPETGDPFVTSVEATV